MVAGTALLGGALVAGTSTPASADPVALTLDYVCDVPRVGERTVEVEFTTDLPPTVPVGQQIRSFEVATHWTFDAATRQALRDAVVGGFGEGAGTGDLAFTAPGLTLPLSLPYTVDASTDDFSFDAAAWSPSLSVTQAGEYTITAEDFALSLPLLDTGGYPIAGDPAPLACSVAPGQDNRLAHWELGPAEPGTYSYALEGAVHLRPGEEGETVTGDIELRFDDATGTVQGESTLLPTTATLTAFGVLPVTAQAEFDTGTTTGTFADGRLAGTTPTEIRIPRIEIRGIVVGGGPDCRASEPTIIDLWSPEDQPFVPETGGHLSGTYDIAPLENCGPLTSLISSFATGEDFGIELDLDAGPPDDMD